MINRALPEYHSLRRRLMVFAFLMLLALSYGIEKRLEMPQQALEIDYN